MKDPIWLTTLFILAVHARLLAEHGGGSGLRDEGLLEAALAGPRNHHVYRDTDLFDLAAAYAEGITRNHPFIDGNKRTAFAAAGVFLELNGHRLTASEPDAVQAVLALTKGDMNAVEFAAWLRLSSVPREG